MEEIYEIVQKDEKGVPVFFIRGYFTEMGNRELRRLVDPLLETGQTRIVLDFSGCTVINSLGIAGAMDLSFEIIDELEGRIAFSGLNKIIRNALEIAGLIPLVGFYHSVEDAVEAVLED